MTVPGTSRLGGFPLDRWLALSSTQHLSFAEEPNLLVRAWALACACARMQI